MKRNMAGFAGCALAFLAAGATLTATRARASDGDGLSSFIQTVFAPSPPASGASASMQVPPAEAAVAGLGRRSRLERLSATRRAHLRAEVASRKLKTRYVSLPKAEEFAGDTKPKALDGRAAELARTGEIQAALLQDSTLRSGDIVITAEGPKVFVGRDRERHRAGDFQDAARSRRVDEKTRRLLVAMVAPRGALAAEEARTIMAKLRRPSLNQEVAAASRSATNTPRVISTALSQPNSSQVTSQAR